jgi:hypothetical protein
MSLLINKIIGYDPANHPLYFLDANVWIAALKNNQYNNADHKEQKYIDFFDAIIQLNILSTSVPKKKIKAPKIVMTSMLLSEIINAYLRNIAMPLFFNDNKHHDFKKEYREEIYSDYDKQLKFITTDIQAFNEYLLLIDDNFVNMGANDLLSSLDRKNDFNDLYYYKLFKDKGIAIVTEDKDFCYDDIVIITNNESLKRLIK